MKKLPAILLLACLLLATSSPLAQAMPGRVLALEGYWEFTLPDGNPGWMTIKYTEASAMEVYDIWLYCRSLGNKEYYAPFHHPHIVRPNTWYGFSSAAMRQDTGVEGISFYIVDSGTMKMKISQAGGKYDQTVFIAKKK